MALLEDACEFAGLNGDSVHLLRVLLSRYGWHSSIPPGALVTPQQVVRAVNIILLYQHVVVVNSAFYGNHSLDLKGLHVTFYYI